MRTALFPLLVVLTWTVVGCQTDSLFGGAGSGRFRSHRLGQVEQSEAFEAARGVLGNYYTIASVDPDTWRIVSKPKMIPQSPSAILSTTPARERAELRIRRDNGFIWADVRVTIEHQQTGVYRSLSQFPDRRDVPNQTPAYEDAPLTKEQNVLWRPAGYNLDVERRILQDLYERMKKEGASIDN